MIGKIVLIVVIIILASLVLTSSITGFVVKKDDLILTAMQNKYYEYYKTQADNVKPDKIFRCTEQCKTLAKKFHWPVGDYWYVSFVSDKPYVLEFIISGNKILYRHIGENRIISI